MSKKYLTIVFCIIFINICGCEEFKKPTNKKQRQPQIKSPAVTSYSYAVTDFGEKTGSHSKTIQVIKNYIANHKPSAIDSSGEQPKSFSSVDTIVGYINGSHQLQTDSKYDLEKLVDPSIVQYVEVEGETTKRPRKKNSKRPKSGTNILRDAGEFIEKLPKQLPVTTDKVQGYSGPKGDAKATISASVFGRGTPSSLHFEQKRQNIKADSNEVTNEFDKFENSFTIKEPVYKTIPASPLSHVNKITEKYSPPPPEFDLKQVDFKKNVSVKPRQIIHSTIRPPNTVTVTTSSGKRFDLPRSTSANNLPPYVSPTKPTKPTPNPIFNIGITSTAIPYLAPNVRNYYQQKAFEDTGPIFFPGVGYGGILFNEQTGEPELPQSTSPQRAPGLSSRLPPKPLYNYNRGYLFNLNANLKNPNFNNSIKPFVKTGRSRGFRYGG